LVCGPATVVVAFERRHRLPPILPISSSLLKPHHSRKMTDEFGLPLVLPGQEGCTDEFGWRVGLVLSEGQPRRKEDTR
jgi:hypothetical protein